MVKVSELEIGKKYESRRWAGYLIYQGSRRYGNKVRHQFWHNPMSGINPSSILLNTKQVGYLHD